MARTKSKRELSFKPQFRDFSPLKGSEGVINLHHEEIEAIYLMDYKGMYQEEAAKSMGVSRPTFSRIIKNARMKIATSLVIGKKLHIEDEKAVFVIAFICDDTDNFGDLSIAKKYIMTVSLDQNGISSIEKIENPLYDSNEKPSIVIPKLLASKNVNYFLLDKIGEGFKNTLVANGIFPIIRSSVTKEQLPELVAFLE